VCSIAMFATTMPTAAPPSLLLTLLLLAAIAPDSVNSAPFLPTPELMEMGGISDLTPILHTKPVLHIPLHLIVDKAMYRMFGSAVYPVQRYCSELVQIMNHNFQFLNIRVVLVRLEIWTRKDGFTIGNDSVANYDDLVEFIQLRAALAANGTADAGPIMLTTHTQLLTGKPQFDNNGQHNLGRAAIGSICTDENVSVVRFYGMCELDRQATTSMHELGHAIGLEHTPDRCSVCIMSPTIALGPSQNRWTVDNANQFAKLVSSKRCMFIPRPPAQFRRDDMLDAPRTEVEAEDDGARDSREDFDPCLAVYKSYQQGPPYGPQPQLGASEDDGRFETYETKLHTRGEIIRQSADAVYIIIMFIHMAICSSLSYFNYMERQRRRRYIGRRPTASLAIIKLD
jgi:Reprolysin (M12B) family zinc metalloprotease